MKAIQRRHLQTQKQEAFIIYQNRQLKTKHCALSEHTQKSNNENQTQTTAIRDVVDHGAHVNLLRPMPASRFESSLLEK